MGLCTKTKVCIISYTKTPIVHIFLLLELILKSSIMTKTICTSDNAKNHKLLETCLVPLISFLFFFFSFFVWTSQNKFGDVFLRD